MVSCSQKQIHSKEYICVEFLKFFGKSDEILRHSDGLIPGSLPFQIGHIFSPNNFGIVHIFNLDWKVQNMVVSYNPLHFLDSGKSYGVL